MINFSDVSVILGDEYILIMNFSDVSVALNVVYILSTNLYDCNVTSCDRYVQLYLENYRRCQRHKLYLLPCLNVKTAVDTLFLSVVFLLCCFRGELRLFLTLWKDKNIVCLD